MLLVGVDNLPEGIMTDHINSGTSDDGTEFELTTVANSDEFNDVTPPTADEEAATRERERIEANERRTNNEKHFMWQLGRLMNANLSKLDFGGAKVSGAWVNDSGYVVVTTASGQTITLNAYAQDFYQWSVTPAILAHARTLGHEPTDFQYTYGGAGYVSACGRCDAMARITDQDEVIAGTYMATCKGRR